MPNAFIDYWLARLPAAEVRVWLFGCRQTAGFQKEEDAISVKQITDGVFKKDGTRLCHGTGLKRRTAFRALEQLEKQDLVKRVFRPGFATKYRFFCPERLQRTARAPVHYAAHKKTSSIEILQNKVERPRSTEFPLSPTDDKPTATTTRA